MPVTPHVEQHFTASDTVRDIIIGMADGLTVPFALAAGLSGATSSTDIIVIAGLAEIAAGSISMGLGGYLASRSDVEHYNAERLREEREVKTVPEVESAEVAQILQTYGLTPEDAKPVVAALRQRPKAWIDFMMRFELGLEQPNPSRAVLSGLTIALAYMFGGFIPLGPYILLSDPQTAVLVSVIVTMAALAVLGYVRGRLTSTTPLMTAGRTLLIGGLAAGAAYGIARWIA